MLVGCPAGNPRGIPARDSDPLQAFRELIERRKRSKRGTVRLRLFPNRYEEEVLFDIGLACARPWNELNYEKRQAFFKGKPTKKNYEINRKYYYKYNDVLGVNVQAVIQKNDETWNAFFELLKPAISKQKKIRDNQ